MKSSRAALGVVVLLLGGLWLVGGGSSLPPSAAAEEVRVSEPVNHDNLTVYFIHGKDLVADVRVATLQEALAAGWVTVHETGSVNELAVENRSPDTELFIQEGDIIKGGKQDRLIAIDMLLPPNSGRVSFPAHCVEQGRWTGRAKESATEFNASTRFAVGNDLKLANAARQQGEVWKNVAIQQDKLSENVGKRINAEESASSLQLALENPAVIAMVSAYEDALRGECGKRKNVVGVVFAINGKMTGAEVYGSSALFEKAWPKLLNSAASEALAEKKFRAQAAAPTAREVERFLACGGEPKSSPSRSEDGVRFISDGAANDVTVGSGEGRGRAMQHNELGVSRPGRALVIRRGGEELNRAPNSNPAAGPAVDNFREVGALLDPAPRVPDPSALPGMRAIPVQAAPGNRLTINRVDSAAGLMTECRDPARGNAVIHKSYIKR